MIRLFKSTTRPQRWVASIEGVGWVQFPAEPNGWEKRGPVRGLDPLDIREVPLRLAQNTGMPMGPTGRLAA